MAFNEHTPHPHFFFAPDRAGLLKITNFHCRTTSLSQIVCLSPSGGVRGT